MHKTNFRYIYFFFQAGQRRLGRGVIHNLDGSVCRVGTVIPVGLLNTKAVKNLSKLYITTIQNQF